MSAHIIKATVTIPRLAGRRQKFDVAMTVTTVESSSSLTHSVSGLITDAEATQKVLAPNQTVAQLQALDKQQAELSQKRLMFVQPWKIDAEASKYELTRVVEFNNRFDKGTSQPFVLSASLSIKYWPDESANPDLALPPGGGPGGTPVQITLPR